MKQGLWKFLETSPGSPAFMGRGWTILTRLRSLIQSETRRHGFSEVSTPQLFRPALWEQSGHWGMYREDMYAVHGAGDGGELEFGLKPMNCPAHCLLYASEPRARNHLPLRFSECSPLHRNEATGALGGLTRVRRFHQDDAHIFCAKEQVGMEVRNCLEMVRRVWGVLGFREEGLRVVLSTRPEEHIGDVAVWDEAERVLMDELVNFVGSKDEVQVDEGEGAFYGPKLDVLVKDFGGKEHQCGTVQLDFNLPERFDLVIAETDHERPVIVHRAILGSFERSLALLSEFYGGRWPFWLSPDQVAVVSIQPHDTSVLPIAHQISSVLGDDVIVENGTESLNRRIRNAQIRQTCLIAVLGEKELESDTVNLRTRDPTIRNLVAAALEQSLSPGPFPDDGFSLSDSLQVYDGNILPSIPPIPSDQLQAFKNSTSKTPTITLPRTTFLQLLPWLRIPRAPLF